ncbi:MAG: hypothetical protein J6N70_06585 [Oribacterium sp.]|nr:hypothetical protein [Oribacterium sp.]
MLITYKDAPIQDAIQDEVNALREHCPDLVPQITVCTGYTECSSGGVTAAQLIAQADEKLYVAKEIYHGRKSLVEQGS